MSFPTPHSIFPHSVLRVSGLPLSCSIDEVIGLLSSYGRIIDCRQQEHGVAIVCYEQVQQAQEAISVCHQQSVPPSTVPLMVEYADVETARPLQRPLTPSTLSPSSRLPPQPLQSPRSAFTTPTRPSVPGSSSSPPSNSHHSPSASLSSSSSSSTWTHYHPLDSAVGQHSTAMHPPPPPLPPHLAYLQSSSPSPPLSVPYLPPPPQHHTTAQSHVPPMLMVSHLYPSAIMPDANIAHSTDHPYHHLHSSYSSSPFTQQLQALHSQPPQSAASYNTYPYSHSPDSLLSSSHSSYANQSSIEMALHLDPSASFHASLPASSSPPTTFSLSELFGVRWRMISVGGEPESERFMNVTGWKQFEDKVRATVGGRPIKVYHSFSDHSRVKVGSDSVFEAAVGDGLVLSVWVCQPGKPSPPLRVDTSSPAVAQQRHIPPSSTPPRMAPLTTPPSTSRVRSITPSSTTPSPRRNQQRTSPSVSSSPGSSSPVSSHEKTMGNRVKKRDGVCVFTHVIPLIRENNNCHILAAAPSKRLIDGAWWEEHRQRMVREINYGGHLDQYVMSVDDYMVKKAPVGFPKLEGGLSHIIALPWGGRENDDVQYMAVLGLYAHNQFNSALEEGEVKLEIHEQDERAEGNFLDFGVDWSMAPSHWEKHFKESGVVRSGDEHGNPVLDYYPHQGRLKQPPTVEGQRQWPDRLVFELYSMVWYPFCRRNDQ